MRIFLFILSLIIAAACVFLNILNFNGTLSQTEFLLVNVLVEFLLCMILGHFMHRTYANYKRAKNLSQELTNAQAALQLKTKEAAAAKADTATAREHFAATQQSAPEAPVVESSSTTTVQTMQQAPSSADQTQPLPTAHAAVDDLDATTLFKAPLTK